MNHLKLAQVILAAAVAGRTANILINRKTQIAPPLRAINPQLAVFNEIYLSRAKRVKRPDCIAAQCEFSGVAMVLYEAVMSNVKYYRTE